MMETAKGCETDFDERFEASKNLACADGYTGQLGSRHPLAPHAREDPHGQHHQPGAVGWSRHQRPPSWHEF